MGDYRTLFVRVPDGLNLAVRVYGHLDRDEGRPLICLAGLTRNNRDFHPLAEILTERWKGKRSIVAIDSRGRGLSDRDPDASRYSVPVEAADVLAVMDHLGISEADFIGTSRGGLILHVLAGTALHRLGSIVLNDIGPAIGLEGMRQIQSYLDPDPVPQRRREVLAALKIVHGEAFPLLEEGAWNEMVTALYRSADPSRSATSASDDVEDWLMPDFDPAIAATVKQLDLSKSLPDLWPLFDLMKDKRLLVIRGENSVLLNTQTVFEMQARHSRMDVLEAKGQGHAPLLHLGGLVEAIGRFLDLPSVP